MVDKCMYCSNNSTNICNLCKQGYFLVEFYGTEKKYNYNDCWSFKKLAWFGFFIMIATLISFGLCFIFYRMGRSSAMEMRKRVTLGRREEEMRARRKRRMSHDGISHVSTLPTQDTTRRIMRRKTLLQDNFISNMPTTKRGLGIPPQVDAELGRRPQIIPGPSISSLQNGQNVVRSRMPNPITRNPVVSRTPKRQLMVTGKQNPPQSLPRTASTRSIRGIQTPQNFRQFSSPSLDSPFPHSQNVFVVDSSVRQIPLTKESLQQTSLQGNLDLPREIQQVISQRKRQGRRTVVVRADGSKTMVGGFSN